MVVHSAEEYEKRAIRYALSLKYDAEKRGSGKLYELRKKLFLTRDQSALFDTQQWVRNAEASYEEMWRRYVAGTDLGQGDQSRSFNVANFLSAVSDTKALA